MKGFDILWIKKKKKSSTKRQKNKLSDQFPILFRHTSLIYCPLKPSWSVLLSFWPIIDMIAPTYYLLLERPAVGWRWRGWVLSVISDMSG